MKMVSESEVYNTVKTLLEHLASSPDEGFEQAALDEVVILVEAYQDHFPDRFVNLLKENEGSNFPQEWFKQDSLAQRLKAILQTYERIPSDRRRDLAKTSSNIDELFPTFTLNEDEKERIAHLCDKLRKIVYASNDFDQPHKVRLLNRIAAIECEAQKPKGKFDVFLGGMSDFGEALGKFGTDSKPIFDRISEIVKIGRRNTKDYDQLPAPEETKQLPPPEEDEGVSSE